LTELAKKIRKEKNDLKVNPIIFKTGDLVFLRSENNKKLEKPYSGPFEIIQTKGVNSIIKIDNKLKEIHNNRLKLFKNN